MSQNTESKNSDIDDEADSHTWIPIDSLKAENMQSFAWDIIKMVKELRLD